MTEGLLGILVHDENDLGILASLPSHVDKGLLTSWKKLHPAPQNELLSQILSCLADCEYCPVDDSSKLKITAVQREFYSKHPEAQNLLARGSIVPPTVSNHQNTTAGT